jgi:TonB-linked SusC/RagA family outer membrane protein
MRNGIRKARMLWVIVALICLSVSAYSQIVVKGRVTDAANGQTMPGATVTLKGTTTGSVTDVNGDYTITVKSQTDVLVFSFIGYQPMQITVGAKQIIDVALAADAVNLNEIVVMGYSEKKRTEISSSVSVLAMDKTRDATTGNIANMLQGKVAGVQVVSGSGAPGSESEIRIRGVASLSAPKGPLVVVDGIIGGNYDPNDVEAITVLKDAGATGMYGSQANGGVIIVTTKKGKSDKPQFDFKTSVGMRVADHGNVSMMNGSQLYDRQKGLYRDYASGKIDVIKFYNERPLELDSRNFSWMDEMFDPALVQSYYMSARRSTDKFGYYIGASYFNEDGTFKNTNFKKLNLRANTTYTFSKRVSIENNINIGVNMGKTYDYMDMYYTYLSMPWDNPYNTNGSIRYVDGTATDWWSRDKINPLHTVDNSNHNYKGMDVNYDFVFNLKIANWLSFTSSNRASLSSSKSHSFVSKLAAGTYHNKGFISEDNQMGYGGISTNLFKFKFESGDHSISGLAGFEAQGSYYETLSAQGKGLPEGFEVLNVASGEFIIGGVNDKSLMRSFISQANYSYKSTYFLTGSYRIDATSAFPPANRTAHFPSVAASWLASNEAFLKDNSVLDLLKLRVSYGITGMKDIGAYQYLGLFSLNTQYNSAAAAIPYQLPNPNLTWEKTHQFNLGIDLGLFKRVNLMVDFYNNITHDLLIQVAQPPSVGFEKKWENVGQVTNKGIEVTLSTINIKTADFEWSTDFTFGKNTNKLSGIGAPIYRTVNGIAQIYREDGELYTFILPKWLGVDPQTGAPQWEHLEKDENGNVTARSATSDYAEATPQEIESALPKFQGGIASNMRYRSFSLNMNFSYMVGNYVYNFSQRTMDNDGHEPYYNQMEWKEGWSRWTQPGDVATHPSVQNSALSTENSSRYLEDGSYLKIRNITLKYELPSGIVKQLHLQGLAVSASAENAFTFTNYWGQDPEVTINSSSWQMPGVSDFKYPGNKQYVLTLEVKF